MLKIIFLILVIMSSAVLAQTTNSSSNETPKAELFSEFRKVPNGQIRSELDSFLVELQNNPDSQGYMVNYGTRKDVATRERLFRNHLIFRKFDPLRIVFVNGGFRGELKTVIWIVPYGAKPPTIKLELNRIDEFGEAANGDIKARLDNFLSELKDHPTKQGYVVITGQAKAVLRRERLIKKHISFRRFDSSRIKFVNDGFNDEIKTELWIDL